MVTVLNRDFYLSEIVGRRIYLKTRSVGKLKDLVIQENAGKVPEVTHLLVHQPYGDPRLLIPWDKITLISNTEIVSEITKWMQDYLDNLKATIKP